MTGSRVLVVEGEGERDSKDVSMTRKLWPANKPLPRGSDVMESMVEVLAHAERNLRGG